MKFDAIIVLGAAVTAKGNLSRVAKSRMDKAIELYWSGAAPRIIVTGKGEASVMKGYAIRKGIPRKCVLAEHRSVDTIGNAFFTRKLLLSPNGWRAVAVVTSLFHAERAKFIFRKVLGKSHVVEIVPSRRVLSERVFRLKLQSERRLLLVAKFLGSLIADGDMDAIENFLRKRPDYWR